MIALLNSLRILFKTSTMLIFLLFMCLSISGAKENEFSIETELTIAQGKLKGSVNLAGTIRRFLGIPYASVNGRFQEPGIAKSWDDTFDATQHSPVCKQPFNIFDQFETSIGTEDCLVLNVYTPISAGTKPLPVMVFIHGGGFVTGSNTDLIFDPKYLVQKNNIVITINYRLGILGFLCLRNKGAPGNVGLKDQVAALKWIKKNVQYFGGNPNLVTLFGNGCGAASINYMLSIPSTNGLFQRAILQGGSIFMPQAFDDRPVKSASLVAADLGFNSTDPDELLKFFNDIPIDELIGATSKHPINHPLAAAYVFKPCIEASSDEALITAHPRDLMKSANLSSDVQVIIGYNDKEGIEWASKMNYTDLPNSIGDLTDTIPDYLKFSNYEEKKSFVQSVKEMYIGNEKDPRTVMSGLIDYFSDSFVMFPSVDATEYLLKFTNATVYNYQFGYFLFRNFNKLGAGQPFLEFQGASHGDELYYLFDPTIFAFPSLPPYPFDGLMIYRLTMMWSYFALNGNPSIPIESGLPFPIKWTESNRDDLKFLDISFLFNMTSLPNKRRIDFWRNAFEKYGKHK